jgi:asparagine synthase (glutamine-hydrolysing)
MKDVLPLSLLSRPKQGFTLPFEKWMRHELFREIDATLTSADLNQVGLSTSAVARIWSDFQGGRSATTWSRPWALYTLKRWADQNDVCISEPPASPAAAESFAATP